MLRQSSGRYREFLAFELKVSLDSCQKCAMNAWKNSCMTMLLLVSSHS